MAGAAPAGAAFPGQNGKIAFSGRAADGNQDIYLATPGVPGTQRLTTDPAQDGLPAWSADGTMIVFVSRFNANPQMDGIYVMRADGSGKTQLSSSPGGAGSAPTWSPDGTKIIFSKVVDGASRVFVMNSDGSNVVPLTNAGKDPVWSADGTKIAVGEFPLDHRIHLINPDGTGATPLPGTGDTPDWSPDSEKIAFSFELLLDECNGDTDVGIYWATRTGGRNPLPGNLSCEGTGNSPADVEPAWSPDGQRVAWTQYIPSSPTQRVIHTAALDGTSRVTIDELPDNFQPDWQPVHPGYPRPKSASPVQTSLVPAYIACTAANRIHGPPLAFDSCYTPRQRSAVLTVGTPDTHALPAGMTGFVRYAVQVGNPATEADEADVAISVMVKDVRCGIPTSAACPGGPLSDYEGRLLALAVSTRVTDRSNLPPGPNGVPGTGDTQLKIPLDCAATTSTSIGSTCTVSTTADALMPGAVLEGRRAIWELNQVHVRDAGPNGTGFEAPACPPDCGDGDETLFLRQGIFVP